MDIMILYEIWDHFRSLEENSLLLELTGHNYDNVRNFAKSYP